MTPSISPYAPPAGNSALLPVAWATAVRYRVMLLLTLASALSYVLRSAVSVAESTIRVELGLTLTKSAWFMAAFFWSYAFFQVPSGWLSQRYGTRFTLVLFAVGWSTAALMLGLAPGFWLLVLAQVLMGIAQAGVFPAACNSIARWMPITRRSLSCAVLASGMQGGAIIAGLITGWLLSPIGWRGTFVVYALPGFVWAAWFWWSFRDHPQQDPNVNAAELAIITHATDQLPPPSTVATRDDDSPAHPAGDQQPNQTPQSKPQSTHQLAHQSTPWWQIASNSTLWFLCGQQMARASGYMFFASWFPTFLQTTRGVSINASGGLQSMVFTGTLVGSLCGGLLVDWIFRRTSNLRLSRSGVGAAALASCGLLILASWFVQSVGLAVLLMTAGSICAALAGPCAFSATIDVGGRHVPQVFGTMNMAGNIAAAICPIAVATLFSWTANWNLVLLLFAGVYLVGAACWLGIDPKQKIEGTAVVA